MRITSKKYRCNHCGHETLQATNHYVETYSAGAFNRCPNCGWKRPTDITVWECMEKPKKYARMAAGSLYYVDKDLGVNRECSVARRVEILAGPTGGNYRVKFGDGSEAIVWKIYLDNFTEE